MTSQHIIIELFGAKKRINSIKNTIRYVEQQNKLKHDALVSTRTCVVFLYSWGHLILYSNPNNRTISIDLLSSLNLFKIDCVINALLEIFKPDKYEKTDIARII